MFGMHIYLYQCCDMVQNSIQQFLILKLHIFIGEVKAHQRPLLCCSFLYFLMHTSRHILNGITRNVIHHVFLRRNSISLDLSLENVLTGNFFYNFKMISCSILNKPATNLIYEMSTKKTSVEIHYTRMAQLYYFNKHRKFLQQKIM